MFISAVDATTDLVGRKQESFSIAVSRPGPPHPVTARRTVPRVNTADLLAIHPADLQITRLVERTVDSPLSDLLGTMRETVHYVTEHDRVLIDDTLGMATRRGALSADLPAF